MYIRHVGPIPHNRVCKEPKHHMTSNHSVFLGLLKGNKGSTYNCSWGHGFDLDNSCRSLILIGLKFFQAYLKEYPPLGREGSIQVVQDVDIYTILDLDEVAGTFQVQFQLTLKWIDPRLKMHNLKAERLLNMLPEAERTAIWVPVLTMDNTEKKDFTLNDDFTYITVSRQGEFVRSTSEVLNNVYIYEVRRNSFEARYTILIMWSVRKLA